VLVVTGLVGALAIVMARRGAAKSALQQRTEGIDL
jgi:hypothetical protein